jgi:hypothetical protein
MTHQRPSRLALAVFDRFIPDNDPLRGDLLEEFECRRSQWWLWRQVLGAAISRRPLIRPRQTLAMTVLGAALLVLASFEAVFAVNVVRRLIFGPAMPDITGYFFLWQKGASIPTRPPLAVPVSWIPALLSVAASMPAGWMIAAFHQQHKSLVVALFTVSVALCAVFNLGSPFTSQFVTMLVFVMGLLIGGRLRAPSQHGSPRVSRLIT